MKIEDSDKGVYSRNTHPIKHIFISITLENFPALNLPNEFLLKVQRQINREKILLSINGIETFRLHMQENEP